MIFLGCFTAIKKLVSRLEIEENETTYTIGMFVMKNFTLRHELLLLRMSIILMSKGLHEILIEVMLLLYVTVAWIYIELFKRTH